MFVCMYVFMCVFNYDCSHTVQPPASKLWHNILNKTTKNLFSIFKIVFLQSYCPFSIFLKDCSVNLKSNYAKTRGGRNDFFNINQQVEDKNSREKIFAQKWPGFLLCLFDFQIVSPVNHSQ